MGQHFRPSFNTGFEKFNRANYEPPTSISSLPTRLGVERSNRDLSLKSKNNRRISLQDQNGL